jgi:hypothetical protein
MEKSAFEKAKESGVSWSRRTTFVLLGFASVVIITAILLGYYWYKFDRFPWESKSEVPAETTVSDTAAMDSQLEEIPFATEVEKIARVGDEYLFTTDLADYAVSEGSSVAEIDSDTAIDELINESVLLQAGENEGWIELSSEVFHNPFKDYSKREELLLTVEERFEQDKKELIVIESVCIFIHNQEYGELAQKIENVYYKVKNEGVDMKTAGEILANDESLAQLDSEYVQNAYSEDYLSWNFVEGLGVEDEMYLFLQNANVGDVSEIILEKLPGGPNKGLEIRYVFHKLETKVDGFKSIVEWIDGFKEGLIIEKY